MKNLVSAIAIAAIVFTPKAAIAGNVRIVDNGAPHCLNAMQIIAVAQWLTSVTPGWARVDLMVIGNNPQYNHRTRRSADNSYYYEFWNEYLDQFAYIFSQGRIPIALTCFEKKSYELEEEFPANVPEFPWMTDTNILKFKGIPIAGTDAFLSIPTKLQVITAQEILSIF